MGDSGQRSLELRNQTDEEVHCDELLNVHHLHLDEWILNHIDYFASQCRGNDIVTEMHLVPSALNGHDDEVYDKVGQAIGNLQTLERIYMYTPKDHDDDEVVAIPDWEKNLACILSRVRQRIILIATLYGDEHELGTYSVWRAEDIQSFARAIHGHPTIIRFEGDEMFPYESLNILYSALATLPALESVKLSAPAEHESILANPQSLTELLRVPTLRCVFFNRFSFTRALFQAAANALMEGTMITKLQFCKCSFPAEESVAVMANAFTRNTSVVSVSVRGRLDVALLIGALAVALPSNSTLRNLSFVAGTFSAVHLSRFFLALGTNTGLKALTVEFSSGVREAVRDESLCTAIKDGLELNETLESLEVKYIPLCDDNADLWRRAFSFLRTNKTLQSLVVAMRRDVTTESCLSTFRVDIVTILQENTSLESLSITSDCAIRIEEYFALVTALQHNKTLKTLGVHHKPNEFFHLPVTIRLTDDEDKQIAALLQKNYAMERLPDINMGSTAGDVHAILRLNEAGRRYLVQDGTSISRGVEVLSRVNNDIDCVFLHLLENPRLCDRRAVEMVSTGETSNRRSTNPNGGSSGGKREQAPSAHEGNESRRRLA
jgi:hypothetical protein